MRDFTGFIFGDKTSEELGITRISEGDRYEEELFSELKDITAEVPGIDGEYYFGSNYGPREITIDIAFDSLTEKQFRELRAVFSTKKIKQLIFDERPYKKYMAKVTSPIELSYVCFDEPKRSIGTERDGVRVAERTTSFTSEITSSNEELEVALDSTVFQTQLEEVGSYDFIYDDETSGWLYEEEEIDLATYGIECVGEPVDEDTITVIIGTLTTIVREQVTPYEFEEGTERIYKGEGKITFICYFPFAKSVYKQLPSSYQKTTDETVQPGTTYYTLDTRNIETVPVIPTYTSVSDPVDEEVDLYYVVVLDDGVEDWADSSGILSIEEYQSFDTYDNTNGIINTYNAGDIETGFRLYIPAAALNSNTTLTYKALSTDVNPTASLVLNSISTLKDNDVGVLIDTNSELIIGVSVAPSVDLSGNATYTTSGNIYNEYVNSGCFFHLEPNGRYDHGTIEITGGAEGIAIFYDYLYF